MKALFVFLVVMFFSGQVNILAQNYDEYKYKNIVVTIKAGDTFLMVEGLLYDVRSQREKVFYENEDSNSRVDFVRNSRSQGWADIKGKSSLVREVDKQYLIIRHKRSEFMIDIKNVICIEIKKW